jgi:hypothetical protein
MGDLQGPLCEPHNLSMPLSMYQLSFAEHMLDTQYAQVMTMSAKAFDVRKGKNSQNTGKPLDAKCHVQNRVLKKTYMWFR